MSNLRNLVVGAAVSVAVPLTAVAQTVAPPPGAKPVEALLVCKHPAGNRKKNESEILLGPSYMLTAKEKDALAEGQEGKDQIFGVPVEMIHVARQLEIVAKYLCRQQPDGTMFAIDDGHPDLEPARRAVETLRAKAAGLAKK